MRYIQCDMCKHRVDPPHTTSMKLKSIGLTFRFDLCFDCKEKVVEIIKKGVCDC